MRVSVRHHDAAEYFVDLLAYPPRLDPQQLASSPLWTTHFDPKGENGPAGSVRVELQLAHQDGPLDRRAYHKRSSGCNPSTATPSSSTLLPTALRLMKTRCGRKSESSTSMTIFVKRRAASGIPRYRAGKTLPRPRTRTNRVASSPTTRSPASISISRRTARRIVQHGLARRFARRHPFPSAETRNRRRATSARSGRRAGCHCFRVVR